MEKKKERGRSPDDDFSMADAANAARYRICTKSVQDDKGGKSTRDDQKAQARKSEEGVFSHSPSVESRAQSQRCKRVNTLQDRKTIISHDVWHALHQVDTEPM